MNALTRREFLLAAAGMALAACGQQLGGGAPAPTGTSGGRGTAGFVAIGQGTDVESWNPYGHISAPTYNVWEHIFNTLIHYDYDKKTFSGDLAQSWEVKDPLTWVFHLRQGIHFHDGSPFTADDLVYSYNRIRTDKGSKQAPQISLVDRLEAQDPQTFVLRTKMPFSPLLDHLADLVILSRTAAGKYGSQDELDRHPTGTGPYRFVSWQQGQQFVLTRNDDYWGGKPAIAGGAFKPIPEDQARLTALQTGAIQVMDNLPPQDIDVVKGSQGLHVAAVKSGRVMFIGLQPKGPLASTAVRQAMNYAVDVDEIIKSILGGRAYRINQPLSDNLLGHDPDYRGYAHDPEKAKALLQQAGLGGGFDIVLTSPSGRYIKDKEVSQAIAGQLQQVGIRCRVDTPEWGTFSSGTAAGQYPMFLIGRGQIYDPDNYLSTYFEGGVTRRIGYSNPQVNALFRQERAEFDQSKRLPILQALSRAIMADPPVIPLFVYEDSYGVADSLSWKPTPQEYVKLVDMRPA